MSEKMSRRERERAREEQRANGIAGGGWRKFFNPPEGVPVLKLKPEEEIDFDIMPFLVSEMHPFYNDVMADVKEFGGRADHWYFRFGTHKKMKELGGEVFCANATYGKILGYNHPKAKCPICEARFAAAEADKKDWRDPEYDKYQYTTYVAYVVCPTAGEYKDQFMVFIYPENWLHKKLDEKSRAENVYFLDTSDEGTTVHVLPTEQTFVGNDGKQITTAGKCIVSFKDRTVGGFTAEDLDDIPDLMSFFNFESYDEIYERLHGVISSQEEETEEEEIIDTPPTPAGRRSARTESAAEAPTVRQPNENSRRGGRRGGGTTAEAESAPASRAVSRAERVGRRSRTTATETPAEEPYGDNINF